MLPDGLNWLCYLAGSSKSHRENSISCIFLESPCQVGMKNVAKCWKNFCYFTTLQTYRDSQNSTASEVLYAASWICGEFAEHLASPEVTLKALFLSNATNSLPGHILSIYLQNGKNLVSDTLLL